jgi:ribose/xylose/arabinose/galactoside ABC-type transport system permease subunit
MSEDLQEQAQAVSGRSAVEGAPNPLRSILTAISRFQERGVLLAFIVVFVAAALKSGTIFLQTGNLIGILQDVTFLGFITVGMSFALVAGEIDISVGSIYGLVSVSTALRILAGTPIWLAILMGLGIGLGAGLLNALVARIIRVPAIIVTLATLGVFQAFSLVLTNGSSVSNLPPDNSFYNSFGQGSVAGTISWISMLFLLTALVGGIVLARTPFGFRVYAVGSNPRSARLVGIDVPLMRIAVLTLSGFTAAIAGVTSVAYLTSASPTGGQGYELDALAAIIIGGAKLTGGRGTILGTVIGLFVVGIIRDEIVLAGVSTNWQTAVSGTVLLAAVAIDSITRRKEDKD